MNYYSIVFMQGDDARETLKILETNGKKACCDYLAQWDFGGESENCMTENKGEPWGTSDKVLKCGRYTIAYNLQFGYISLARRWYKSDKDK